ncbi:excalibur calcium-binding domain-containing protein [Gordonia sp. BP-94]|nr:excalibur calcium-binding domain-containing protein [Gordonia sp. BP-119]MBN0985264.1 excalibur calcium-binding domain-containing protein [Gordonia sp. BP-94]
MSDTSAGAEAELPDFVTPTAPQSVPQERIDRDGDGVACE